MDSPGTSDDSNVDCCGHDTFVSFAQSDLDHLNRELSTSRSLIERYERYVDHLNWHCHIYRKTLSVCPEALQALSKVTAETERKREPVCLDCEKDDLLEVIEALNKEVGVLETWKGTEKATSSPTNEENIKEISPILSKPQSWKKRRLHSRTSPSYQA